MARYIPTEVPRGVESRVSRQNPIPSPIDPKYPSGRGRFVSFHRLSLPWPWEWSLCLTNIAPLSNQGVSSEWGVKPGGVDFQSSVGSFFSRIRTGPSHAKAIAKNDAVKSPTTHDGVTTRLKGRHSSEGRDPRKDPL
eukprot:scaffold64_cov338-Pavlova_lutheri.AAC.56